MRAAFIEAHGDAEAVKVGERPRPERRPGEALVRVRAAALNAIELYMLAGGEGITHALPMILGVSGAGVVEAVDPDEPLLRTGDRVLIHPAVSCARCRACLAGEHLLCPTVRYLGEHRDGVLADYVAVPGRNLIAIPESLSMAEAACLPVSHLTAFRMAFTRGGVGAWSTVLVIGLGDVSLAAAQLAHAAGARVLISSRDPARLEGAAALGLGETLATGEGDLARRVLELTGGRGADVVLDNVGGPVWPQALRALRPGGRLVTCGATAGDQPSAELRRMFIRQLEVLGSTLGTFEELARLADLCGRGLARPVIASRYPLEETRAALTAFRAGERFGKVVVELD